MASHESTRRKGTGTTARGSGHGTSPPDAKDIPDKLYFRIGEVAALCDIPAHVLRFWETEFSQLRPNKGGTGQRLYRRRDVEMALRIKALLYDQGYTISGARQAFKQELRAGKAPQLPLAIGEQSASLDPKHLRSVKKQLQDLHDLLSAPVLKRTGIRTEVRSIRRSDPTPLLPELDTLFDQTESPFALPAGDNAKEPPR